MNAAACALHSLFIAIYTHDLDACVVPSVMRKGSSKRAIRLLCFEPRLRAIVLTAGSGWR